MLSIVVLQRIILDDIRIRGIILDKRTKEVTLMQGRSNSGYKRMISSWAMANLLRTKDVELDSRIWYLLDLIYNWSLALLNIDSKDLAKLLENSSSRLRVKISNIESHIFSFNLLLLSVSLRLIAESFLMFSNPNSTNFLVWKVK